MHRKGAARSVAWLSVSPSSPWLTSVIVLVFGGLAFESVMAADPPVRLRRQAFDEQVDADQPVKPIRVDVADTVFQVYDITMPTDGKQPSRPRFLSTWYDRDTDELFVFDRVLLRPSDVGWAILALETDLGVDGRALEAADKSLALSVRLVRKDARGDGMWIVATRESIQKLIGIDGVSQPIAVDKAGGGTDPPPSECCLITDPCCEPPAAIIIVTDPPGSLGNLSVDTFIDAVLYEVDCCPWNSPPPRHCPCCSSSDPCCGSSNRCCGEGGECCGSPDPCCDTGDPCCGDPDRCCNQDNPCCESDDPCCNSNDPCCGDSNRCCNPDNPCCGSEDPCCNSDDPCCGDLDRCCNDDNPCCGSPDPCCNSNDPCCGNPNPCCNPDNPCCENTDPCDPVCGDPCLCMTCDDGNPCTDDTCSGGTCQYSYNSNSCDDNDGCTVNDVCSGGACSGTPLDCDDNDICTINGCTAGACWGEPLCPPSTNCCDNGECCSQACEGCFDNGTLDGTAATIDVNPPVVCLGDTITFTVSGVTDTGGVKRVDCSAKQPIDPVTPTYMWRITKPDGTIVPPLASPPEEGADASIVADIPGTYSVTFGAKAVRECPPTPIDKINASPATASAGMIRPEQVTFSGPDLRTVLKDDGSGAYGTPHWKDNSVPPDGDSVDVGDHNFPVVYPRGTRMYLSATFSIDPPDALTGAVSVTGTGSADGGPYVFTASTSAAGGVITITDVPASALLVNQVDYFDPMTIDWVITPTAGQPLNCNVASTTHRVYVTLGPPLSAAVYESVADIGCRNAIGQTTDLGVFQSVYGDFTDRIVRRKLRDGYNTPDNVQMRYWNPPVTVCQTWQAMLAQGDGNGSCKAWSDLLNGIALSQGIFSQQVYLLETTYVDDLATSCGGDALGRGVMLVKNWSFASVGSASGSCQPFTHLATEVFDQIGAPAQGNADPPGGFYNHFIARFQNAWYDPSYGTGPFSTQSAWENASIDGFGKCCFDGVSESNVRKQNDPAILEMAFTGQ